MLDIICTSLSQPIVLLADLINLGLKTQDQTMLSQICCAFRDYFWDGLEEAFGIYGDIRAVVKQCTDPQFGSAFLSLWGLEQ